MWIGICILEYVFYNFNLIKNNYWVNGRDLTSMEYAEIFIVVFIDQGLRFISTLIMLFLLIYFNSNSLNEIPYEPTS